MDEGEEEVEVIQSASGGIASRNYSANKREHASSSGSSYDLMRDYKATRPLIENHSNRSLRKDDVAAAFCSEEEKMATCFYSELQPRSKSRRRILLRLMLLSLSTSPHPRR